MTQPSLITRNAAPPEDTRSLRGCLDELREECSDANLPRLQVRLERLGLRPRGRGVGAAKYYDPLDVQEAVMQFRTSSSDKSDMALDDMLGEPADLVSEAVKPKRSRSAARIVAPPHPAPVPDRTELPLDESVEDQRGEGLLVDAQPDPPEPERFESVSNQTPSRPMPLDEQIRQILEECPDRRLENDNCDAFLSAITGCDQGTVRRAIRKLMDKRTIKAPYMGPGGVIIQLELRMS